MGLEQKAASAERTSGEGPRRDVRLHGDLGEPLRVES